MRKHILIFILILFNLNSFSQSHDCDTIITKTKIALKRMPANNYNIVYENENFKLYFVKNQVIDFAKTKTYKFGGQITNVKPLLKKLNLTKRIVYFSDPIWVLNKNPKKYGYDENDYSDDKKSSMYIIGHNTFLKNSALFEKVLEDYLLAGQFLIYDKRNKTYLNSKFVYCINTKINSGSGYNGILEYQLKDGRKLFKLLYGVSLS